MLRMRCTRSVIFCALFIAITGVAISQPSSKAPQIETEKEAKGPIQYQRELKQTKRQSPLTPTAISDSNDTTNNSEHSNDQGTEFWPSFLGFRFKITDSLLVLFTAVLAVFTGLLWSSTNKLWKETQATSATAEKAATAAKISADITSKQFYSEHRPRIVIRRIAVTSTDEFAPDVIGVQYVVANTGDTEATVISTSCKLWIPKSTDNLPPNPPHAPSLSEDVMIKAGESHIFTHRLEKDISSDYTLNLAFWNVWRDGGRPNQVEEPIILFLGHVDYRDKLGNKHQTGFLRRYNCTTGRFAPINEPEYEYQD